MWAAILTVTVLTILIFFKQTQRKRAGSDIKTRLKAVAHSTRGTRAPCWTYSVMKDLIHKEGVRLPAMFVDLDIFDNNTKTLVGMVEGSRKTLRMATKSIRCPFLIKRIARIGGKVIHGYMCYSLPEVVHLATEGLDDFYVAYPTLQKADIKTVMDLMSKGHKVTLTVDCVDHIKILEKICGDLCKRYQYKQTKIGVSIDLDLSFKLFGGYVHLGAHRSKVDSVRKFSEIVNIISTTNHVTLVGVMGYEAHVAGLPDNNPFASQPNALIRLLKEYFFYKRTLILRKQIADYCNDNNIELEFFNGGGTGNLRHASSDPAVTEVTAGSGFLQAQLFDYFVDNKCQPALCFALQATRVNSDYIVCQSGGFVASGSCSKDKFPKPFSNPKNLEAYNDEGYGEVQTPLRVTGNNDDVDGKINVSDPVLFRPAKSGEIGEHFNEYILIQNKKIVGRAPTYRGLGFCFH